LDIYNIKLAIMKNILFILLVSILLIGCKDDAQFDPTIFNSDLSIIENLENGVPVLDIASQTSIDAFYGLEFGGGFIFHVDEIDGTLMVARDYAIAGNVAWGDHFDLLTGSSIGDGLENTQIIVNMNAEDNSLVPNGLEFGSDDYVFKIALDLKHEGFDDWFIPSSDSMKAIFDNVHTNGMGNFNQTYIYWTSTKEGYNPYVMGFNLNSWGGEAFAGSCFNVNGILVVRKF
tara:strand:- start:799 stop:1491 length:693 start_codon:yes stop_codon:yes gene_type:complete